MAFSSRNIIREEEFEEQLRGLLVNLEEADDYTAGAEVVLANEPENGLPVSPEAKIWALPMAPVRDRQVALYYTFDEETVTFIYLIAE